MNCIITKHGKKEASYIWDGNSYCDSCYMELLAFGEHMRNN